jgi:hypothetical protein
VTREQRGSVELLRSSQECVGDFESPEEAFCCPDFRVTTWALCIDPPFAKLIRGSWYVYVVVMSERSPEQIRELLDSLYRVDSGRILATLIRLLGDFDLAEEAHARGLCRCFGHVASGRRTFSHATCPRFLWRLIDEAQWLADRSADDLCSLPVRHRFAPCQYIFLADVSRLRERDEGDRGDVAKVDVRNLAVAGSRLDGTFLDDVLGLGQKVLHEVVRPEDGPIQPRFLQFFLDLVVPSADRSP